MPVVTVSVLHVLFAALLGAEQLAAFHIEDSPDNPVQVTTPTTAPPHCDPCPMAATRSA